MPLTDKVRPSFCQLLPPFLHAVQNQKVFDDFYYALFGLPAADFHGMPRPAKWAKRHPALLRLLRWLAPVMMRCWHLLFAYAFFALKVLRLFVRSAPVTTCRRGGHLALAICERSCSVLGRELPAEPSRVWLMPDGVILSAATRGLLQDRLVTASSLLGWQDFLSAFVQCCRLHTAMLRSLGSHFGGQSYILPDWVLFRLALGKLAPIVIETAEHHDRWAIMADCYCQHPDNGNPKAGMVIVQHGLEYPDTYRRIAAATEGQGLPYRLAAVRTLYLHDEAQLALFTAHILSPSVPAAELDVRYCKSRLALQPVAQDKPAILFVGHPICEDFHLALFQQLHTALDVLCFYKPHPVAKASNRMMTQDWHFIAEADYFPAVNMVVSYPSTLVAEYAACQIPALEHPLDVGQLQAGAFFSLLQAEIERVVRQKNADAGQ